MNPEGRSPPRREVSGGPPSSTKPVQKVSNKIYEAKQSGMFVKWYPFLLSLFIFVPLVSAHGGEVTVVEEVLSNGQILLISMLGALVMWQLTSSMITIKAPVWTPVMMALLAYTGLVHLLLGLNETLLLVGGIGALAAAFGLTILNLSPGIVRGGTFALGGGVCVMLVGFFLSNHDLHMLLEDRLGLSTKLAEIALLAMMVKHGAFDPTKKQ